MPCEVYVIPAKAAKLLRAGIFDESLNDPGSAAHRFTLRRVRDDNEE
jgi:hypothetical protein